MARNSDMSLRDSDARMRPGAKGRPGGNIVDEGTTVKGKVVWQRMAGNKSNPATRATGPLVDPNTRDKIYVRGNER